jgi:hypothetical protein
LSNIERILKRRRDVNEAELDDLRHVVLARLAATMGDATGHLPASDRPTLVARQIDGGTPGEAAYPAVGLAPEAPPAWLLVAPFEDPDADTTASVEAPPMLEIGIPAETGVDSLYEALAVREPNVRPQPRQGQRSGRAAAKERRRAHPRSEARPCCPYCAVLLEQLPETDDRCPRCRQRMIVLSVGARVAILAEAALPFFEAERQNEERWTSDRQRWLELARESGTGSDDRPELVGELISEGDVAAARAWYMSSADRAFRVAERDRQWDEAARIRYAQAGVLSTIAGSSGPPSDEVVRLHRDGLAADLQALGEVARNAEVRGESCCETCRADDHRVVQLAEELRSPTLPHEGCPDGLCRCRWFLTTRDRELLAALLRRQMGADRRTTEPGDEPGDDAMSAIA